MIKSMLIEIDFGKNFINAQNEIEKMAGYLIRSEKEDFIIDYLDQTGIMGMIENGNHSLNEIANYISSVIHEDKDNYFHPLNKLAKPGTFICLNTVNVTKIYDQYYYNVMNKAQVVARNRLLNNKQ